MYWRLRVRAGESGVCAVFAVFAVFAGESGTIEYLYVAFGHCELLRVLGSSCVQCRQRSDKFVCGIIGLSC